MGAIKVYDGVNDRQLRRAAVEANVSKAEVLGCLIALWLWGLENADSSGLVERCDPDRDCAVSLECIWKGKRSI